MVAPLYIGQVASDGSLGNTNPETFTYSGSPTAGNLLVLVYGQGIRNSSAIGDQTYSASGWTIAAQGYNEALLSGLYHMANIVIMTKVADGTENGTSFTMSHSPSTTASFGQGRIYEFEANAGVQVTLTGTGAVADPSDAESIVGSTVSRTALWAFAGTNNTGGSFLTYANQQSFTNLLSIRTTSLKVRAAYRETITGTTSLPTVTDPDADVSGRFPFAWAAVLLGPADPTARTRRGLGLVRG